MTIINEEALKERARALYTVPTSISADKYDTLSETCKTTVNGHYVLHDGQYLLNTSVYDLTSDQRYALLRCLAPCNGFRMVLVSIQGDNALLEVHFYNRNFFDEMAALANDPADPSAARKLFPITGGRRVPAGEATGQVQVRKADPGGDQPVIRLTVSPIGDYSTYTLGVASPNAGISIDPLFSEIDFKFRPGCFSIDCAPEWAPGAAPKDNPVIDYLAKDYHSFKHTLISAMTQRVPGWRPTSEADLDQVLLELFSAAADELSDYQDRVMNEAYLGTARKRVSLARHARLVDYHIHQGNQASTWLAVALAEPAGGNPAEAFVLPKPGSTPGEESIPLTVWGGSDKMEHDSAVVFISRTEQEMHPLVNRLGLYTWGGAIPSLAAGSTSADLQPIGEDGLPLTDQPSADSVRELIHLGKTRHFLIQEWLNPFTGRPAGSDPRKRQLLRLVEGDQGAESMNDPVADQWFVRVQWDERDALEYNYCFTAEVDNLVHENIFMFHGNLVPVYHGRPASAIFKDPDENGPEEIAVDDETLHAVSLLERTDFHREDSKRSWTLCRLPFGPLAYQETPVGGDIPPKSTLHVGVLTEGSTNPDPWDEVINLVHSDDSIEAGDHFMVETDENGNSVLRFGNGVNGRLLPPGVEVHCTYQVGRGPDGNIGADVLKYVEESTFPEIRSCWNPFDVTNGRAPEPVAEILRRAPEAYRYRQLRAVTLQDYIDRAEELETVSKAAARYAWTGSWRTVQISIDPVGITTLTPDLRRTIAAHLDAVRLIGEDLEIRPPRFVPLDIRASICIHPDYWIDDVRYLIDQEFSEGYTPDGRMGFFHPDRWTFGQKLHASEILGRIQRIEGVGHVVSICMKRWNEPTPGKEDQVAEVRANEIIRVRNDPDHMEDGFMTLTLGGGRK